MDLIVLIPEFTLLETVCMKCQSLISVKKKINTNHECRLLNKPLEW